MNKETFDDFLKSLKLSLKSASIYPINHPTLIKSVEEVKEKINVLLKISSPLKISFSPQSLLVEGKYFEKEKLYDDVAQFFHFRKIKNMEINEGLTAEELLTFLAKLYLAPENVEKEGGLSLILKKEGVVHLALEDLDYFQLLQGEGEDIKNIWPHLLEEAVKQEDVQKITELADSFERVIGLFKTGDILGNEEFKGNVDKFLNLLKKVEKEKHDKCLKDLLKSAVKDKALPQEKDLRELRKFFKDLSADDFASTLLEEIITDDDFDPLSFQIFSELTKRRHEKIAGSFVSQFRKQVSPGQTVQVKIKIKDLMTGSSESVISEVYRQTLTTLLKDITFGDKLTFDQSALRRNYQFILLNLLDEEKRKKRVVSLLENILSQWENIVSEKKTDYVKPLIDVLNKRKGDLSNEPVYKEANKRILQFIVDRASQEGEVTSESEDITAYLKESFLGIKATLDKIFKENLVNPQSLKLFFGAYPDNLSLFNKKLKEKSADSEFLGKIISCLANVDSLLSLDSLKSIYSFADEETRIRALKAMEELSVCDENFLLKILEEENPSLRRETLQILKKNRALTEKALGRLFSITSPFGLRNKVLVENARIIREMEIKEARESLTALSKRKFIWNKKLRREILKILQDWDARQD